jgi:hypothetical protein
MLRNKYHVLPPKSIDMPFMPYTLKCIILTTQNFEKKTHGSLFAKGEAQGWGGTLPKQGT